MPEVLVIQNAALEGLATLGELLDVDGFKTKTILATKEKIPSMKPLFIVLLGAPESANDDLSYLKAELCLIRDAVDNNIPVLGICLGSQLIAKAFGANVYRGTKKEIGFYHDIEFDNVSQSRLFNGIRSPATVFHWHGDTFDLPQNAIGLAHSRNYQNQALKVGSAVGVQFHLEVDEETIRLWLEKSKNELTAIAYINPDAIVEEISQNLETIQNNLKTFYRNFKSEFNL
jgi:GMP synthase (glutamine-hydrolysing)